MSNKIDKKKFKELKKKKKRRDLRLEIITISLIKKLLNAKKIFGGRSHLKVRN
jgi:hypothetical protein